MRTPETNATLTQDDLKTLVGQAALQYVVRGEMVGVGTGSTVDRKSTRLNSSHSQQSRMPSSA